MSSHTSQPDLNLAGRSFAMVSSTASAVDAEGPTVFHYQEQDGLVWGKYDGDTVRLGRFVGSRLGEAVHISFAHVLEATGEVASGSAESAIQIGDDGVVELIEYFGDDGSEMSVCRERTSTVNG